MSRPRTPTKVLELTGAFKKNPQRRREDPATAGPLGDPPGYFNDNECDIWHEIAAEAPECVLTSADRGLVELATHLRLKLRMFGLDRKDGLNGAEMSQYTTIMRCLGCSPSDRSKVSAVKPAEAEDELAFLN